MYPYGVVVKKYNKGLAITIGILSLIFGIIFLLNSLFLIGGNSLPYFVFGQLYYFLIILLAVFLLLLGVIGAFAFKGVQSPVGKGAKVLLIVGGVLNGISLSDMILWFLFVFFKIYLVVLPNWYYMIFNFLGLVGNILVIIGAFLYLGSLKRFNRVLVKPQNPFIR